MIFGWWRYVFADFLNMLVAVAKYETRTGFRERRSTRSFKAPERAESLSQNMYLSNGSGTSNESSREPSIIRFVPLIRAKPGPEYKCM
jgi:hypothetical protein